MILIIITHSNSKIESNASLYSLDGSMKVLVDLDYGSAPFHDLAFVNSTTNAILYNVDYDLRDRRSTD
jgi:hypothetical protein